MRQQGDHKDGKQKDCNRWHEAARDSKRWYQMVLDGKEGHEVYAVYAISMLFADFLAFLSERMRQQRW